MREPAVSMRSRSPAARARLARRAPARAPRPARSPAPGRRAGGRCRPPPATLRSSSAKRGSSACARSTNSRTAPCSSACAALDRLVVRRTPSGPSRYSCSSGSAQRLLAGHQHAHAAARLSAAPAPAGSPPRPGARSCRAPAAAAALQQRGQLVERRVRAAQRCPSTCATPAATSAGSASGASSTSHTPSAKLAAAARAPPPAPTRVLPMPPAPTMVTSRCSLHQPLHRCTSASRPYSGGSSAGRLVGVRAASGAARAAAAAACAGAGADAFEQPQ